MNSSLFLAQASPTAAPVETAPIQPGPVAPITGTTQSSAPTTQGTPPPWWANQMFPLMILLVAVYLFLLRPKKGKEKQRTDMLNQLKRGDRVQTIGGILGTVVEAKDNEVLVKVDESNNTKLRFTRNAIHRVVEEEKEPVSK